MDQSDRRTATVGSFYALGAFGIWGFGPLFYKAIGHVPADEILAHRVVWCMVLVTLFLALRGRLLEVWAALRQPRLVGLMFITASTVAVNWFLFIWSILNDRVIETSLGYYINPLLNVVLGALFLKERLSRARTFAVALASLGVLTLIVRAGAIPWAGLGVAFSFALYGLLRKLIQIKAVVGMQMESMLLTPLALAYLIYLGTRDTVAFGGSVFDSGMLIAAGLITAVPLIFFAEAARRLTLSTVGFFQYLAPTTQFLLAVLLFGEPFTTPYVIAFACIWVALAIYSLDGKTRTGWPFRPKAAATP